MKSEQRDCPGDDTWVTAVLYRGWLEHVSETEPLWHVPYFGQAVRSGTAEENLAARKYEHEYDAVKDGKEVGFHAVIDCFGKEAIEWTILDSKSGPRSEMQAWADAYEKRLIAEHGGMLRDMTASLWQTLNLTEGGSGIARWAGFDAYRMKHFRVFKKEMELYVEKKGSSLVPFLYITVDKYHLGHRLNAFRRGQLRKGLPEQVAIEKWAEELPNWSWNGRETSEYILALSQRSKDQWDNASETTRAEWCAGLSAAQRRPEVRAASVQRGIERWEGATEAKLVFANATIRRWETASEETKDKWKQNNSNVQLRPEVREKKVESNQRYWDNASEDEREARRMQLVAAHDRKREIKMLNMTAEERKVEEKKFERKRKHNQKRRDSLQLLRTVLPNANRSDLARARKEGWMPKSSN